MVWVIFNANSMFASLIIIESICDGLIDSLYVCKCELNSLFCSVV